MPIDPSIPLRAGNRGGFSLNDILQQTQERDHRDQQLQMQRQELAQRQATFQAQQQKGQNEQHEALIKRAGNIARTIKADPSKYAMGRTVALRMGIPPSEFPETYDPKWVDEQVMMADAWDKDGGQSLTSNMKELVALGYKPGTPEFQSALAQSINAGYAKPYTGSGGETRLYTPNIAVPQQQAAPQAQQAPQAGIPQPGAIEDGYRFLGGNPADPRAWEPVGYGSNNIPSGNPLDPNLGRH